MLPVALTIAGSDPSGGAGLQADLKTFHQFGVYGEAVVTLLTVQNTQRVSRVEVLSPGLVREQIEAVVTDIRPLAAKTGALGNVEVVHAVSDLASRFSFPLIVDPVMISKHGAPLLSREAERAIAQKLIPHAALVTPNLPEAATLAGIAVETEEDIREAAKRIRDLGAKAVLIKGGHRAGDPVDVLLDEVGLVSFPAERIATKNTHGTGCTYAAAITACVASGHSLREAIRVSRGYIKRAIQTAPGLGLGSGPVNHFAGTAAVSSIPELL
jgi:hydroxymethylpyrimidine/phosphomethylpyrimidine kinase